MSTAISNRGMRGLKPVFRPLQMLRQEFDDLFGHFPMDWDGSWSSNEFQAACDVSETADAFEIRMDVPGIKPDDIAIEVTGDIVHIRGARNEQKDEQGKSFHRMERRSGSFAEAVRLPGTVDAEKIEAEFHDGVLTIMLPKAEVSKTRTVKIKADGQ